MGIAPASGTNFKTRSLQGEVRNFLQKAGEPKPTFNFRVGFYDNYDALFRGNPHEETNLEQLLRRAIQTGRVVLSGRGGSGKTQAIRRVAGIALQENALPILIDLVKWRGPNYDEWNKLLRGSAERANFLLRELAIPKTRTSELDVLPARLYRLVLIDGLNEVTGSVGDAIIQACDVLATFLINTSVIIGDRLVRRELPQSRPWLLASVLPLQDEEIRRNLGEQLGTTVEIDDADEAHKELLREPYILDSVLRREYPLFRELFLRHASLTADELAIAGRAAYEAYADTHARSFSLAKFKANSNEEVVRKLLSADFLKVEGNLAYFDHHLKHDFLAAVYVSADRTRWNRSTFDVVSFHASSFDCLAMALEEIGESEAADEFVRQLYDWNPYSPAYAVAEALRHGRCRVSHEMQIVLLAMLAERRWDLMQSTVKTATDAICLFQMADAASYLNANSLETVFDLVNRVGTQAQWFLSWRNLFGRAAGSRIDNQELALIREADSVRGWTLANVLRRLALSAEQEQLLIAQAADNNPTIRWRIIHVLGAKPSTDNLRFLLKHLEADVDIWVRRGAMRSTIELAARAEDELRANVFNELTRKAENLAAAKPVLAVLRNVVFIRPEFARQNWVQCVKLLIGELFKVASSVEERDEWIQLADKLEAEYVKEEDKD